MNLSKQLKIAAFTAAVLIGTSHAWADSPISQAQQQAFTPDEVLNELMAGNARFVSGQAIERDVGARIVKSASGQFPKAVILSCLDSRVPVEKVFDVSIGDIFVGRNAGNLSNPDQLGSMEFATAASGAKVVMVLGHTACGAVAGAIAGAELGNLTQLLQRIQPVSLKVDGFSEEDRVATNGAFVNAVADESVLNTLEAIRRDSPVLADLEKNGDIKIVGAGYDLETGRVYLVD